MSDLKTVERVVLWMVSGMGEADLTLACVGKLSLEPERAKEVIAQARSRLTLAAKYNPDELLGTALTRLNDLYSRCIRAGTDGGSPNLAKALDVQREINRLTGLYRHVGAASGEDETSDEARELAAVGGYLLPLRLCSNAYPLREHARLAAGRIAELEALLGPGDRR